MSQDAIHEAGFTMIELLVAMAVFSFMLLIIAVGFINVVRLHNQAIAANQVHDSANSAMQTLVQAVRDSQGLDTTLSPTGTIPNPFNPALGVLMCVRANSVSKQAYYVSANNVLTRADDCDVTSLARPQPLSASSVNVTYFSANQESTGPAVTNPEVTFNLTVASANGTATGTAGQNVGCNDTNQERQFCSTINLTSGAVPR